MKEVEDSYERCFDDERRYGAQNVMSREVRSLRSDTSDTALLPIRPPSFHARLPCEGARTFHEHRLSLLGLSAHYASPDAHNTTTDSSHIGRVLSKRLSHQNESTSAVSTLQRAVVSQSARVQQQQQQRLPPKPGLRVKDYIQRREEYVQPANPVQPAFCVPAAEVALQGVRRRAVLSSSPPYAGPVLTVMEGQDGAVIERIHGGAEIDPETGLVPPERLLKSPPSPTSYPASSMSGLSHASAASVVTSPACTPRNPASVNTVSSACPVLNR